MEFLDERHVTPDTSGDKDVPCLVTLCFVTCYPKCGVCKKVGELVPTAEGAPAGGTPPAPDAERMERLQ